MLPSVPRCRITDGALGVPLPAPPWSSPPSARRDPCELTWPPFWAMTAPSAQRERGEGAEAENWAQGQLQTPASCRPQPAAELGGEFIVVSVSLEPRLQFAVISKVGFLLSTFKKSGGTCCFARGWI